MKESSEFDNRRTAVAAFNLMNTHTKRGIAVTPMKFGISFTATLMNQAGALVLVFRDGSVQVNHGGTEMGQGLFTKIHQIAADSLGVSMETIRLMPTRTDKVPNTSPTAASASTDLNGAAVFDACAQIKARMTPIAANLLDCDDTAVRFESGEVYAAGAESVTISFATVVEHAYRHRIALFAQGYYRTPEIHFDAKSATGRPFHYYAYGAAVCEVEVDGFTGEHRILRAPICWKMSAIPSRR